MSYKNMFLSRNRMDSRNFTQEMSDSLESAVAFSESCFDLSDFLHCFGRSGFIVGHQLR